MRRRSKDRREKRFRFLTDYIVEHFKTENRLMDLYRYAQFLAHKSEHDAFVKDVSDLLHRIGREGLDSSLTTNLVQERADGAEDWLCQW